MKKLALIYNPNSGDRTFKDFIDPLLGIFQSAGFAVTIHRSENPNSIRLFLSYLKNLDYDTVVVCGGDGSLNMAINAIMDNGLNVKFGIIPSGTANDFATYLNLPKDPILAAEIIAQGNTTFVDLGKANEKYFINVFALGYPANISHIVNEDLKNVMGKMAYYMKGLGEMGSFNPITVDITSSKGTFREELALALVLNGAGAGGFSDLVPGGSATDGLLDFLALRPVNFTAIGPLVLKVMKGEHLDDENVIHFKDSFIKIQTFGAQHTDVDGEPGPEMPVVIKNLPGALEIYCN